MSLDEARDSAFSRYFEEGFKALTPDEQLLVVILGLEAEVNNGGFHQYYFNSYGDFACRVSSMLREIGANHVAQIVDEANAVFGSVGPSGNRDERQKALEALDDDSWDSLDEKFCACPDNVTELLRKHLG